MVIKVSFLLMLVGVVLAVVGDFPAGFALLWAAWLVALYKDSKTGYRGEGW